MKTNKNNNDIKDLIIKIVLIVVIIILLVHNCCLLRRGEAQQEPTGNVDIIEINCDKDSCVTDKKDDSSKDNSNSGTTNKNSRSNNNSISNDTRSSKKNSKKDDTKPSGGEETIEENGLVVKDDDIYWDGSTKAKIFTNSMYELDNVIAPESSNTYQFVVKNATNYRLKYEVKFKEKNQYNINMKYKLKKNDTYIVDHYVSYNELNISDILLNARANDTYYLEWKWISSDNDTEIGKNPDSKYELKIEVKAESVDD